MRGLDEKSISESTIHLTVYVKANMTVIVIFIGQLSVIIILIVIVQQATYYIIINIINTCGNLSTSSSHGKYDRSKSGSRWRYLKA